MSACAASAQHSKHRQRPQVLHPNLLAAFALLHAAVPTLLHAASCMGCLHFCISIWLLSADGREHLRKTLQQSAPGMGRFESPIGHVFSMSPSEDTAAGPHALLAGGLQQLRELAPFGLGVGLLPVGRRLEPRCLRQRALPPRARRMRLPSMLHLLRSLAHWFVTGIQPWMRPVPKGHCRPVPGRAGACQGLFIQQGVRVRSRTVPCALCEPACGSRQRGCALAGPCPA